MDEAHVKKLIRGLSTIAINQFHYIEEDIIKDAIQEALLILFNKYSHLLVSENEREALALGATIVKNILSKYLRKNKTLEITEDLIYRMQDSFLTEHDLEKILNRLTPNEAWILELIREQGDKSRVLYDDNLPEIQQRFGKPFSYEAFRQVKSRAVRAFKKILGNNQF